jgi:hypothetical protein
MAIPYRYVRQLTSIECVVKTNQVLLVCVDVALENFQRGYRRGCREKSHVKTDKLE